MYTCMQHVSSCEPAHIVIFLLASISRPEIKAIFLHAEQPVILMFLYTLATQVKVIFHSWIELDSHGLRRSKPDMTSAERPLSILV